MTHQEKVQVSVMLWEAKAALLLSKLGVPATAENKRLVLKAFLDAATE